MEYINIHVSVIDSVDFQGADPVAQATWLKLLRYACGQEQGDIIPGARRWTHRMWIRTCNISLREINRDSQLWQWENDDLIVNFYPHNAELALKAKRNGSRLGNAKRWGKGVPEGIAMGDAKGVSNRVRKGREGKEKEGKGSTSTSECEIPGLEEVRDWANGGVGVDPDYAEEKWHATTERHGWVVNGQLIDWRNRFLRWWLVDRENWMAKKMARVPQQKTAAAIVNFEAMR